MGGKGGNKIFKSIFALPPRSFILIWKTITRPPSFPLLLWPLPRCVLGFLVVAAFLILRSRGISGLEDRILDGDHAWCAALRLSAHPTHTVPSKLFNSWSFIVTCLASKRSKDFKNPYVCYVTMCDIQFFFFFFFFTYTKCYLFVLET